MSKNDLRVTINKPDGGWELLICRSRKAAQEFVDKYYPGSSMTIEKCRGRS